MKLVLQEWVAKSVRQAHLDVQGLAVVNSHLEATVEPVKVALALCKDLAVLAHRAKPKLGRQVRAGVVVQELQRAEVTVPADEAL